MPPHCYRMRANDRDLIRGEHYGQRSCETAPKGRTHCCTDQCCLREESSCQLEPVTARKRTLALSRSLSARARSRIAELEQEIESLQRAEEAIVVATGAPRERGCPAWVVLGGKAIEARPSDLPPPVVLGVKDREHRVK